MEERPQYGDTKLSQSTMNKIQDRSGDPKYYERIPRIVWAKVNNPYDYMLWAVLKQIAGDHGECWVSTKNLAIMCRMCYSKVQRSRKSLISAGLIQGRLEGEPGKQVWHIRIPNLWTENTIWAEGHLSIESRVAWCNYRPKTE